MGIFIQFTKEYLVNEGSNNLEILKRRHRITNHRRKLQKSQSPEGKTDRP